MRAADRIAGGRLDIFALKDVELGSPPRWNRDPKTGTEAPLTYGKLLDYRDPALVGDIKYLWEPNRHQHLAVLAQAYDLSGSYRYAEVIHNHLESWLDACPYPMGPNWSSALEAAMRLISWAVVWQLLGGAHGALFRREEGARFRKRWLESVFRHAQFIRGHFSLYSSANNHLIGEAAGLFVAGVTWPHWSAARVWTAAGQTILEREALLQNAPDGVNREQAMSYQRFVLELLLLSWLAGRANGLPFSPAYAGRMEAMMDFIASVMDVGGNVPMIGDADDAAVVKLDHRAGFCPYKSLLATGAVLFGRGDLKLKSGGLDDKTRWLLGRDADRAYHAVATAGATLPVKRGFPTGGYYVLGCEFETGREIRLVVDAGALGYQAIAAHGHADALSFTLSVGGVEFLVDPGTYAYHTEPAWRGYFRGTAAHNTVRVDGLDQSQPGGNFMWLRKASAARTLWEIFPGREVFEGWHDGYTRLADAVVHRRRCTLDKTARRVVIEDVIETRGTHLVELFFHCSERCRAERVESGYAVRQDGRTIVIRLPRLAGAATRVLEGSLDPIGGWVSRRFDEKRPAPTIVWRARIAGAARLRTEIRC